MAKVKKELTTKQKIRRNKILQVLCKVGEYAVIPIPFAAMMIAERNVWFGTPSSGIAIGLGGVGCIAILITSIVLVVKESEDKHIANGYVYVMLKWIMACIIVTLAEKFLETIAGVMWIATSGLAASFGLDITRTALRKRGKNYQTVQETAEREIDVEKAKQEIAQEEESKKVKKIKIIKTKGE